MRKKWYNPKDFADMIERFNPFGYKEKDGKVMIFKNYGEVYLYTLRQLQADFPRGYFDMVVFVSDHTGMPPEESRRFCRNFKSFGIDTGVMLVEYWEDNRRVYFELENIMRALHLISGTKFSSSYFYQAIGEFREELVKANTEERIKSGEIIKFIES